MFLSGDLLNRLNPACNTTQLLLEEVNLCAVQKTVEGQKLVRFILLDASSLITVPDCYQYLPVLDLHLILATFYTTQV